MICLLPVDHRADAEEATDNYRKTIEIPLSYGGPATIKLYDLCVAYRALAAFSALRLASAST